MSGVQFGSVIYMNEHSSKLLTNTATSGVFASEVLENNNLLASRTNTFCTSTLLSVGKFLNGVKQMVNSAVALYRNTDIYC